MKKNLFKFYNSTKDRLAKVKATLLEMSKSEKHEVIERPTRDAPKIKREEVTVHFSLLSVSKATLVIIALIALASFVGQITEILLTLFVAILFSAALSPTVDYLERKNIPRSASMLLIIVVLLAIVGFFISQLIPLVAVQTLELARSIGSILNNFIAPDSDFIFAEAIRNFFAESVGTENTEVFLDQISANLESIGKQLQSVAGDTFVAIKSVFNGVMNFILILILTFFITVDEKKVYSFFKSLFPSKHGIYITEKTEAIKEKIGFWLRGQIIIMFLMFLLFWLIYTLIGLDYALTLAMMVGIGELIPVFGALIAIIPALLVAFNQSPWLTLWVLIIGVVVQQIQGNVLVPMIMKKAVGLSPIVIILAMLMGFKWLGILGAIIAVPVATALSIFVADYTSKKK